MDGIDGIAGLQAVTAALGYLLLGLSTGSPGMYLLGGSILFASLAFLFHNWPPARIFMGDAGSAFLGYMFATMPLFLANEPLIERPHIYLFGGLVVWMFLFDSVFTFLRRLFTGAKVWQAHREHLYQRLVQNGYSHRRTTIVYGAISLALAFIGWMSLAYISENKLPLMLVSAAAAAVILLVLCLKRGCLWGRAN
jgi:UDP-N-acetylmuramyl pentapeptide phosphotransferase/UDP-N-acetylglucosamine-1-phosphate transferase